MRADADRLNPVQPENWSFSSLFCHRIIERFLRFESRFEDDQDDPARRCEVGANDGRFAAVGDGVDPRADAGAVSGVVHDCSRAVECDALGAANPALR